MAENLRVCVRRCGTKIDKSTTAVRSKYENPEVLSDIYDAAAEVYIKTHAADLEKIAEASVEVV